VRWPVPAVIAALAAQWASPTFACSIITSAMVFFPSDSAELNPSADPNLSIARAEAVQRALEQRRDGRVVRISERPDNLLVPTAPGVKELKDRFVSVQWTATTEGRTRCDPATENGRSGPPGPCGTPKYAACYVELEDGTV
jgi:hypothetical protein